MSKYLDDTDNGAAASDLYGLYHERNKYGRKDFMHTVLGPAEHKQFVRETTRNSLLQGAAVAAGAPAYTAAKALGLTKGRSAASVDEIFSAWEGFAQGVKDRRKR